jgi:hypothetical protein
VHLKRRIVATNVDDVINARRYCGCAHRYCRYARRYCGYARRYKLLKQGLY